MCSAVIAVDSINSTQCTEAPIGSHGYVEPSLGSVQVTLPSPGPTGLFLGMECCACVAVVLVVAIIPCSSAGIVRAGKTTQRQLK